MAGINDSDSIVAAALGIYVGSAYIIGFFFDLRGFLRLCRCFVIDGMSVFVLVGEGDAVVAMPAMVSAAADRKAIFTNVFINSLLIL